MVAFVNQGIGPTDAWGQVGKHSPRAAYHFLQVYQLEGAVFVYFQEQTISLDRLWYPHSRGNRKVICSRPGPSTPVNPPFQCQKNCLYKNPSPPGLVAQLNTTHAIQPTHYQRCLFFFL